MRAQTKRLSDRVRPGPASRDHHNAGDHGADEGIEIGEDVLVGTFDVEARSVGLGEQPGRHEVDGHPDEGGDEDS